MGDLGYLDEQGRVWFCGRKSQRVVTPERTLYTIPCEGVFNAHPEVYRTALVGVGPERRDGAGAVRRAGEGRADPAGETLRQELLALGAARPHTRTIKTILFHPRFPGGRPAQRQDLPRETGRLGGEELG